MVRAGVIGIFLIFLLDLHANAQMLFVDEGHFISRVKQLEQFIGRFNNTESIDGIKKNMFDATREDKFNAWKSVFKNDETKAYERKVLDFLRYVDDQDIRLDINDQNLYARVNCTVYYQGVKRNIVLTLANEANINDGYKWAIAGAYADFLDLKEKMTDSTRFIHPAAHNTNFTELNKAINNDGENITAYTSAKFKQDHLSTLAYLIHKKEIRLATVDNIAFEFLSIPHWIMAVEFFNYQDGNSGWLVSNLLFVNNESEKLAYKADTLFVNH